MVAGRVPDRRQQVILDDIGYDGWGIAEQVGGGSLEGLKKLSGEMDRIFAA